MKRAMTLVNVMTRDVQGPMGMPWGPWDQALAMGVGGNQE